MTATAVFQRPVIGAMQMPADFKYKEIFLAGRPKHEPYDAFRRKHPEMEPGHRAKIFAPFDALKGFKECIASKQVPYEKKRSLSDEAQAELDRKLAVLRNLTWNSRMAARNRPAVKVRYPNSFEAKEMEKGLTEFGKEALPYMEDLGMLVDVSHLSDGGFWDVAHLSRRPFIAAHSNCRTLNPHPRSMTDEMIRVLADQGGVMGLNFCPAFLTGDVEQNNCSVDALADQLRHRINVGGLECAAIGTDFDGIGGDLEIPSADHMPIFFDALLRRGFTPYELDRICYLNVERVFQETIG